MIGINLPITAPRVPPTAKLVIYIADHVQTLPDVPLIVLIAQKKLVDNIATNAHSYNAKNIASPVQPALDVPSIHESNLFLSQMGLDIVFHFEKEHPESL